jgi:hypothetical protein
MPGTVPRREAVTSYLSEHGLESVLSSGLNTVVSQCAPDLVTALGILLCRKSSAANKSQAEVERALSAAVDAALAANETEVRAVFATVSLQLGKAKARQPSVQELRALERTLSGVVNDVLYEMPAEPLRVIGSALLRVGSTGKAGAVGRLMDAVNEAFVAEAHELLRSLASRLGGPPPATAITFGQLRGEGHALRGCRVRFVATSSNGRELAPAELLRHPVAPMSAPLGSVATVSVDAAVEAPTCSLVAAAVDAEGRLVGSAGFSLPPLAPGASQAIELPLGGAGGRLRFVVSAPARCAVTFGQIRGEGQLLEGRGCRVRFVATAIRGRELAPAELLRHPVAPMSAPLGAAGVEVEAEVEEPSSELVAVVVDRAERVVGACRFTLQSAPQAIELPLGTAGRLSFVASVH